jgi:tRNA (uracil-5-)-methyltransferase TRM9
LINSDVIEALQLNKLKFENGKVFNLIVAFGVIHHIPSLALRQSFFKWISELLYPGGVAIIACWQFTNDLSLMKRQIDPHTINTQIEKTDLEENDYFLPWKEESQIARYCHLVEEKEVAKLIKNSGLILQDTFSADGKEKTLNYYLILEKAA